MAHRKKRAPRMLAAQRYQRDIRAALGYLNKSPHALPFIARESGLSYWWLARFARGEITDPKGSKLAALLKFMEDDDA